MSGDFAKDFVMKNPAVDALKEQFREGTAAHAFIVECVDRLLLKDALVSFSALAVCAEGGCLTCPQCKRALKGVHCDVKYFPSDEEKGKITVADTDKLIDDSHLRPLNAKNKVYLLNAEASVGREEWQNKLLKTLEDPPANTFIFLAVTNAESLLQTVRSRCETIRLGVPRREDVERALVLRGVNEKTASFAAGVSSGQLKKAVEAAENPEFYETALFVADLLAHLKNTKKSAPFVTALVKRKETAYLVYEFAEIVLRDSIAVSKGLPTALPEEFLPALSEIAADFSDEAAAVCIGHVENAKRRTDNGGNFTVVADELILRILEDKYRCRT